MNNPMPLIWLFSLGLFLIALALVLTGKRPWGSLLKAFFLAPISCAALGLAGMGIWSLFGKQILLQLFFGLFLVPLACIGIWCLIAIFKKPASGRRQSSRHDQTIPYDSGDCDSPSDPSHHDSE